MKKFSVLLTLAVLMVSSSVFAGSIDYLTNQSAKFLMTFTRNASTDASADIANYNPAGTAFLAQGFYIDVSNQTLLKYYETDTSDSKVNAGTVIPLASAGGGFKDKYEQSEPTILLPNVYAVYNFGATGPGKLAVYGQIGVSAGGGKLAWDDGTAATYGALAGIFRTAGAGATATLVSEQSFEAYSVYYTFNAGAAYAMFDDMVSASLGGKIVMPKRSLMVEGKGVTTGGANAGAKSLKGEFEYEATGYTPVIGLDVKPVKELTIAARYEFETDLEFKYKQKEMSGDLGSVSVAPTVLAMSGISDGSKSNYNLPAILALGVEYQVTNELAVMTSANIFFLSQADMGKTNIKNAAGTAVVDIVDTNKYFNNGWETSIAATYLVIPELKIGAGFIYTESGAKKKYFNDSNTFLNCAGNPPLDSWTIGLGATYTVIENLDLTLSGSWTHYLPESYSFGSTAAIGGIEMAGEYKKDVYNIGIGAGYKI